MNKDGSANMGSKVTKVKPNVVVINNKVLKDKKLSLKAKGLYAILMYLGCEFGNYSEYELYNVCPEFNEAEMEELLNELNKAGYLNREQNHYIAFEEN